MSLGLRTEHNPYSGEMVVISSALETLAGFKYRHIVVVTRNKAAVLTLMHPYQQSGQGYICRIYDAIKALRRNRRTSPPDDKDWKPNMEALRATIQFAMATGRPEEDQPQNGTP